jgi:hypothetical protein
MTAKTGKQLDRALSDVQLTESAQDALSDKVVEGTVIGEDGKPKVAYDYVELKGQKFRVADEMGVMPMLKWAAFSDMSTEDPEALAAIYMMIRDVIHEGDWRKFEDHAVKTKVGAEELMDTMSAGMEVITGRPTKQPDGSAAG